MSQLSRLENEHQEILDELHDLSVGEFSLLSAEALSESLGQVVKDWDKLFGGDIASEAVGSKLREISGKGMSQEEFRELDVLIDPLRYYVIALEKYKLEEYREVVTRAGMVAERVVLELGIELGDPDLADQKIEDAFGVLQSQLDASGISRANEFCNDLRNVYSIRNDRGPHDVPAADRIEAKRCISSLEWIYYKYLEIISGLGSTVLSSGDTAKFTTLLDGILEYRPSMVIGSGGADPSVKDVLVDDLYRLGFFAKPRTLADIMDKLAEKRYNFPQPTVANNLRRLNNEVIRRRGKQGDYTYVEKLPPGKYFE